MRLVIISDTHTEQIPVPDGDVLIHCGDHTYQGRWEESVRALAWFNNHPHKYKIMIAGNHELGWQDNGSRDELIKTFAPDCIYLHHEALELEGVKFFGSPYQPEYFDWAFQFPRGEALKRIWSEIPDDTDILITHGPPHMIGDSKDHFGDEDLRNRVFEVKPKIHCFGHAHEGYGVYEINGIKFVNAAILNDNYIVKNEPIVIDY